MKKYLRNGNIFILLIISLVHLFYYGAQAQRHQWPIGWPQDGADYLDRYTNIDTTDIVRIRKIADSCGHSMSYLFLAQRGYKEIIPKVIQYYYQSIDKNELHDSYVLTVALATLDTALAHPYVLALFDTMVVRKRELKWNYGSDYFIDVIRVLLDLKDYSKYEIFKSYFHSEDKPLAYSIEEFYRFSENAFLRQNAYEMVKGLLYNGNEEYRYTAQQTLYWFKWYPDRVNLFKHVALNDPSAKIRQEASSRLEFMGYTSDAIQCYESLIQSQIDTFYCSFAISMLASINSPYALAALTKLKNVLEPGELLDRVEYSIWSDNVGLSSLYDSLAIKDYVDSLGAFVS